MSSFPSVPGLPPPSSFPRPREVAQESRERSLQIFSDFNTLKGILARHEAVLRKRWMKKTKEQRKKILLAAWPNMPAVHRPEFLALSKESQRQRVAATKFRNSFMWPDINLDDLVHGRLLLLFLNSRGRHLPEAFAHVDFNASHIGQVSGAIRTPFLNEYTMLLTGQKTAETYGKLVSWNSHEHAFNWLHTGLQFHPGHGLLVLETQQHILSFLVKCCHLLFQDMSSDLLTDKNIPEMPEPPPILASETVYQSLAAMAAEAPYRVPSHLDLKRMQSLIKARRSAAEDHIWALREDPSYFADTVLDYSEHRQERLPDVNGKPHPVLKQSLFWERVLQNSVVNAYGSFIVWDKLFDQATSLASMHEEFSHLIKPERSLPQKLEHSFHKFIHLLGQASKGPIGELKLMVPASPAFRSLFYREPQAPNTTKIIVKTKRGPGDDTLIGLLLILWDDERRFLCTLPKVVNEIERLIHDNAEEKERLSPLVARVFSDLALVGETQNQIDLYQPWSSGFENRAEENRESIEKEFTEVMSLFADLIGGMKGMPSVVDLGAPFQKRFCYPVEKRRTRQTTDDMRKAESNLDAFWHDIDQHLIEKSPHDGVRQLITQHRQVERTPEWIEPVPEPEAEVIPNKYEALQKPFGQLQLDPERELTKGKDSPSTAASAKVKVKTRGTAQPAEENMVAQADEIPDGLLRLPDEQPTIAVSKRALKVFSTLFFMPSQRDTAGEIAWPDFLYAMASTGFAAEKLHGSVWQFTLIRLDAIERSINFHEPHPSGKIPYRTARRYARRLYRAYGWTGETFVLASPVNP